MALYVKLSTLFRHLMDNGLWEYFNIRNNYIKRTENFYIYNKIFVRGNIYDSNKQCLYSEDFFFIPLFVL